MAKFIYKMENILSIKYKLEDQAKTAFGAARQRLDAEEEKLALLKERKQGYERELSGLLMEKLELLQIKQCEAAIKALKYKIELQVVAVNTAKQQLELARIHLNEAMVERKTQEKLKENAFEEFKLEIGKEERKETDELTSFTYGKKQKNEVQE